MRFMGMMGLYAQLSALASIGPLAFVSAMASQRGGRPDKVDSSNDADTDRAPREPSSAIEAPATEVPANDAEASLAAAQAVLLERLPPGPIDVYEPGGGSVSYLPPALLHRARVTVVDVDPMQVARNRYADTAICADVQRHWLRPASIDLVVCYNVIQCLDDVESALLRFSEALRPGGLLLVAAPLPRSPSGLVARCSPHAFHVWFYRRIRGEAEAGLPGQAPYPVRYHPLVAPQRLTRYLAVRGFETVFERAYESPRYAELRSRRPALGTLADGVTGLMNLSLLGRANVRLGDYHLVLQKGTAAGMKG